MEPLKAASDIKEDKKVEATNEELKEVQEKKGNPADQKKTDTKTSDKK